MKYVDSRRRFIKQTAITGLGIFSSLSSAGYLIENLAQGLPRGKRVGIIGLDTSHSVAFAKALNNATGVENYNGYQVAAAYPYGSVDIASSAKRIPEYTREVERLNIKIFSSIDELLDNVDVVLLETNDGRLHLEQATKVMQAGKRVFIDKPIAASLRDVEAIVKVSKELGVPFFSSSSLRFARETQAIRNGDTIGKVFGADTYSPAMIEQTHPDLYWYGIHGVEALFTVMGAGCREVRRVFTKDTDLVVGSWHDGRIGTFRGTRKGKPLFGGNAFGEKGIAALGGYSGYGDLLREIVDFFDSGIPPVSTIETIEIYAFMEAADESKRRGGAPVLISEVL